LSKPDVRKQLRGAAISFVCFLTGCGIHYFADVVLDDWSRPRDERPSAMTESLFDINRWYQARVTAGRGKPNPKETVVVAITANSEGQFAQNICMRRLLIARLLDFLPQANPAAIVIGEFFDKEVECFKQGYADANEQVQAAVAKASEAIPVAIASKVPEDKNFVVEGIPFAGKLLVSGLGNRDDDHRRIQLHRWAYPNQQDADSGRRLIEPRRGICVGSTDHTEQDADSGRKFEKDDWQPTLHLVAALAKRPSLYVDYPFLKEMDCSDTSPYTSFAEANNPNLNDDSTRLPVYTPGRLLCGRDIKDLNDLKKWVADAQPANLRPFGGKVVVIGHFQNWEGFHETVLGRMQPVILLANYIESLLAGRLFWPAPWWVNGILGFLMFSAFHVVVSVPTLFWKALGLVAMAAICALIVVGIRFDYYVNPIGLSLLCISAKLITSAGERAVNSLGKWLGI
jgi:CHASE2 domain-containing sensor protein